MEIAMKTMFILASLALAPFASASTNLSQANHYVCQGRGGIQAIMDTTSLNGKPRLYLSGGDIQSDLLSEVKLEQTIMGHHATVSVQYLSDASIDYTFIVPEVMTSLGKNQDVKAILIKTTSGGIMDPSMIPGPIQNNSVTQLSCKATFVIF
jgi:hypothetical protein